HLLGDFSLGFSTDAMPTLSSTNIPFTITGASSLEGATFTSLGVGQLLVSGSDPGVTTDVYTIYLTENSPVPITGLFLHVINDPSNGLPTGGPGRFDNGNFVVTEFTASAHAYLQIDTTPPTVAITSTGGLTNQASHTVSGTVDVPGIIVDAGTI